MLELGDAWPIGLLLLRIVAVAVLYLFLASAFGALRAELRPRLPAYGDVRSDAAAGAARPLPAPAAAPSRNVDVDVDVDHLVEEDRAGETLPGPVGSTVAPPAPRLVSPRIVVMLGGLALIVVLGSAAVLGSGAPERDRGTVAEPAPANEPFGPPLRQPAPGRVTVGLAAMEDSQVRVTVDGVVQFDGTLRARERQAWEGGERIQVWTDSGRTLQLAVNGTNLGAYSPAMGHPDWNRIDFGFWPGWSR